MPSRRLASALIWISPLISFGWLATGCQTAPADRPTALRSDQLVVGMQSDQIKELLGEPASIVPGAGDNYVEETWTYQSITLPFIGRSWPRCDRCLGWTRSLVK